MLDNIEIIKNGIKAIEEETSKDLEIINHESILAECEIIEESILILKNMSKLYIRGLGK